MNKTIELENGKFGYKVLDEDGNTVRVGDEQFDTMEEAEAFVNGSGDVATTAPEAPTAPEGEAEGANAPEAPTAPENGTENLG